MQTKQGKDLKGSPLRVVLASKVDGKVAPNKIYRAEILADFEYEFCFRYLENIVDGQKQWAKWSIKIPAGAGINFNDDSKALVVELHRYPYNEMTFRFGLDYPKQELTIQTEYGLLKLGYILKDLYYQRSDNKGELRLAYELMDSATDAQGTVFSFNLRFKI